MAISIDRSTLPPLAILIAAIGALGGAYGSQSLGDLQPCKLCLYQRWPWWIAGGLAALAILLPAAAILKGRGMIAIGLILFVGASIAFYHAGVEYKWWEGPATCSGIAEMPQTLAELHAGLKQAAIIRCDEVPWSLFGISMAGYNGLFSTGAGLFAVAAGLRHGK